MKRSRHSVIPGSLQQSVQPWSRTKDLHILAAQCLLWLTPANWLQWLGRFANRLEVCVYIYISAILRYILWMHDARYTVIIHVYTPVYNPLCVICVCIISEIKSSFEKRYINHQTHWKHNEIHPFPTQKNNMVARLTVTILSSS